MDQKLVLPRLIDFFVYFSGSKRSPFIKCFYQNVSVGGIFYGWPGYIFVLKEEGVFQELCNQTELIATNQTSCVEQDAKFNSIFVTACLLANFFSTLCGIVMDKFGLLCARVFTSTQMTLGLIMMIFYSNRTALEYGAYLIAMSSIGNLLTNITVQVSLITAVESNWVESNLKGSSSG